MTTLPGIRELLYFSDVTIRRPPSEISPKLDPAIQLKRAHSLDMHRHANVPFTGCPERVTKLTLDLRWAALCGEDIDAINDAIGWGGPFDVAYWRPVHETFWLYSGENSGTLQRRNAATVVPSADAPPSASTRYAPVALLDGTPTTLTLGTVDSKLRTPFTISGSGAPSRLVVRYVPLFSMYVSSEQQMFDAHRQGQTLQLVEA